MADNPGGYAKFGNFKNYYEFNKTDERLQYILHNEHLFPDTLQENIFSKIESEFVFEDIKNEEKVKEFVHKHLLNTKILDIGCNEGEITRSFFHFLYEQINQQIQKLKPADVNDDNNSLQVIYNRFTKDIFEEKLKFLGIDIDDELISRCNTKLTNSLFFQSNLSSSFSQLENNQSEHQQGVDISTNRSVQDNNNNNECNMSMTSANFHIRFVNCDFLSVDLTSLPFFCDEDESKSGFTFVFALSITMWVHINWGDDGLSQFLEKLSRVCSKHLIIEPQPWKSYLSMKKRHRKLGYPIPSPFYQMNVRSNVEEFIHSKLLQFGFSFQSTLGQTKWGRKVSWYSKL